MSDSGYGIEYMEVVPAELEAWVAAGHEVDEAGSGVVCGYKKFALVVWDGSGAIVGVLRSYTAFAEVYVDDIWVVPAQRGKGLGRKLLEALENRFRGKGYANINLVTNAFQVPEFYKKCGYEVEFVRVNKQNQKLTKIFFIKWF